MSRFDLNNPTDFARATLGSAQGVLTSIVGSEEWDIQEGSFNNVKFHVFQSKVDWQAGLDEVTDSGGRRKVKYLYPYVDGQTTDDLGRKPEVFSFNILLHGDRYLQGFKALFRELNKPEPGTLIHPVRGVVQCVMEDFEITHRSETRKAMAINLVMIEHNFNAAQITVENEIDTFKSLIVKATQFFNNISNAITNFEGSLIYAAALRNSITGGLSLFTNRYAILLRRLNKTFNGRSSGDVNIPGFSGLFADGQNNLVAEPTLSYSDIPLLLPVTEGGLQNEDGSFSATIFPSAASVSDPFQNIPLNQLSESTSIAITVDSLEREVNAARTEIDRIITLIESVPAGRLQFNQEVIDLKATAVILQEVFERGKESSRSAVVEYNTPRVMSIREVAFANGLNPNKSVELELLNPELESVNYIDKNTTLRVPI